MLVDKALAGPDGLMTKVACHLSGRPVTVELRKPSAKGSYGVFTRTNDHGYIQIDPHLTHEMTLDILLHEIGHAAHDWNVLKPTLHHLASPGTVADDETSPEDAAIVALLEEQADQFRDTRLAYACRWMCIDEEPEDYLLIGLTRLLTYPEGEP